MARPLIKNLKLIGIIFTGVLFFNFSKDSNSKNMNVSKMDSLPSKGFLFGDDQPYPECHASTIIHLKNGQFLSAWFGGTKEKDDDVGIWMTKGKPGNWDKTFEVAKIKNEPHWNPVLFHSPKGKIYLFFKVGKQIPQWGTWVKTSDDGGETWSDAKELVK